jgi:ElaB/YqjD/DUF883 family membrane-anchored ribosome-binding protein
MTPEDPERLRRDIERTQRNLSTDVNLLAEKVTPGQIVNRRVDRARRTMTSLRDKVMGTTTDTMSTTSDRVGGAATSVAHGASDAAHAVGEAVSETPAAVRRGTEGNPLAAGLIAFGAGWLVSSLMPASRKEQQLAGQAKDWAREHAQPVVAEQAGQLRENLREPAQHAVEEVRTTATDAASTVADETRTAASDTAQRAQEAKSSVQQQQRS